MKKILFALLTLLPATGSAQLFFTGGDIFTMYGRPFRDRNARFESPRRDALQMRLAVDDESDRLTLENWGDNRADIRPGAPMLKLGAGGAVGERYSGATKYDMSGARYGVYGRFGRVELEGFGMDQKKDAQASTSEFHRQSGGAAFAFGSDELSGGVHANINRSGNKGWDQVNENSALGGAVAVKTDLYELGATADFVGRGEKKDSNNRDIPLRGPAFGAQAMLKPFGGFRAALRGYAAMLNAGDAYSGSGTYKDYKASQRELGARLEWRMEAVPLTLGAEYAKLFYDPNYTFNGTFNKDETDLDLKTAGAALRLLGERLLLGVEVQDLSWTDTSTTGASVTTSDTGATSLTAGGELWVLPGFALRASVLKSQDDSSPKTKSSSLAAGIGVRGDSFALDLTARSSTFDEDAVNPEKYTDVKAGLTFRF